MDLKLILSIICVILQFLVFLFVLIATPLDAFRGQRSGNQNLCYSMWGRKFCGANSLNPWKFPYKGFPCAAIRDLMSTAGAFAIFSILITLIVFVLMVLNIARIVRIANMITFIIAIIAVVTTLISWACMAGANGRKCDGSRGLADYEFAGAFGLMVTAWILQMIVCVLVFIS